jgi:glycosyltransferase involved in cell wall biosynthesis
MILTIITVSYNSEKYISKCLSSTQKICLAFPDIEHIVYDGNSNDRTVEICNSFSHVKLFKSEVRDLGAYDAMNKAVKLAKGNYIIYLNSDDFLSKNIDFSQIYPLLKEGKFKWITGFLNFVDDKENIIRQDVLKKNISLTRFLISNIVRHPATFVLRNYQILNPFDLNFKYAADFKFFLNLWSISGHKPKVIPMIISNFRVWDNSLSSNFISSLTDELNVKREFFFNTRANFVIKLIHEIIYQLRLLKLKFR